MVTEFQRATNFSYPRRGPPDGWAGAQLESRESLIKAIGPSMSTSAALS